MAEEPLIQVEHVSKRFCRDLKRSLWYGVKDIAAELFGRSRAVGELRKGEFWAVKDVSFEVRRGECLGLIGPNGAGKSTLLKMLNGLIKPDSGRITMRGRVGALIELGTGFNPILTGRENIYNNAAVLGLDKAFVDRRLDDIIDFAEIGDAIDAPVQSYSSGMKVRLGFAVAAHMEPDVLLIDEVLAVGDIGFRLKCYDRIMKLIQRGTATVLVSHGMVDIKRVSTFGITVADGRIAKKGGVQEAINAYNRIIAERARSIGTEQHRDGIAFRKAEVVDQEGIPKERFDSGEPFRVRIEIESDRETDDVILFAPLHSADSTPLAGFNTRHSQYPLRLSKGVNTVELSVDDNVLCSGAYYFTIAMSDKHHRAAYFSVPMACWFETIPEETPHDVPVLSLVKMNHSWTVRDSEGLPRRQERLAG